MGNGCTYWANLKQMHLMWKVGKCAQCMPGSRQVSALWALITWLAASKEGKSHLLQKAFPDHWAPAGPVPTPAQHYTRPSLFSSISLQHPEPLNWWRH